MSPKKIDSKEVISRIFGEPKEGGSQSEEAVTALLTHREKKHSLFQKEQKPAGFSWGGSRNVFGGLDIGNDSIKFVLLAQERLRVHVKDVRIEKINAAGARPEELEKEMMNTVVKMAQRVRPKTKIGITLNDQSIYMESLTLPRGTEEELRETVRKGLSERQLIDPQASFFDFVTSNGVDPKSATQDVFIVAAPRELVYRQFELAQTAGFKVLSVETNALASMFALRRVVKWERNERILVLDIGCKYSSLSVLMNDRIVFSRIIPIAGERFTKAIEKAMTCSYEKAEQLKLRYGLKMMPGSRPVSAASPASEHEEVSRVLTNETEIFLAEVERSLQFAFAKQAGEEVVKPSEIYLFGGGARLAGFSEYLEKRLGASVRQADIWEGLACDKVRSDPEYLSEVADLLSVSLGIALRVTEWKALPFGWGAPG